MMKKLLLGISLWIGVTGLYAREHAGEKWEKKEKTANTVLSVLLEKVKLTGYGQFGYTYDSYNPSDAGKSSNTFDIKRIMFMAEAQIIDNLTMYFMYDFGGMKLHEYWGEYRFYDAFKIKGGQFKVPFTIESLLSPSTLQIISGAQSVQYLAGINPSDICYTGKEGQAGRDIGIMASGDFFKYNSRYLFGYKLGIFNGQGINKKDANNHKDVVGMLTVNPLQEIMLAGSFYIGRGKAAEDNPYGAFKKEGNYQRNRWSIGAEITTHPIYIRSEFIAGKDAFIKSRGGYATASLHVRPKWDIIASFDYFNKNTSVDDKQTNYIIGTQWNFYRRCRLQAQYVFQDRGKGRHNSNLLMTQIQLGF